jgi:hypothetical protein
VQIALLGAQVACVPADVTHVVVSIGGNDALLNALGRQTALCATPPEV